MTFESQAAHDPASDGLAFDLKTLKAKYLSERDKRLRADANEQYLEMKGRFARFLEDPYIEAPGLSLIHI